MGLKGRHHRKRRPAKLFNQVGERQKDLQESPRREVKSSSGNTTPPTVKEACTISRDEWRKTIREGQAE